MPPQFPNKPKNCLQIRLTNYLNCKVQHFKKSWNYTKEYVPKKIVRREFWGSVGDSFLVEDRSLDKASSQYGARVSAEVKGGGKS